MFDIQKFISEFFLWGDLIDKSKWKLIFEEMAVHTRKALPERILKTRRPNEEESVYNYRLLNYEPITYGSMNKAFDSLFRLMNGINYNLQISEDLRAYINQRKFCGFTLEGFLSNIVLKRDIEDPNGFLLWFPHGDGVTDNTKKVIAKPMLVYSNDLHYCDEDVFTFLSTEKSKIKVDGKEQMTGNVYWIFTKTTFYKFKQVKKNHLDPRHYELEEIYEHNVGEIPALVLGGDMNAEGCFESFFAPYCAFGNEAIRQFSDWQAALTRNVHPHVEVFATQCELRLVKRDSNRKDPDNDGTEEKYSHRIEFKPMTTSPHNETIRPIPDPAGTNATLDVNVPSKRWNSPPVENAKYAGESWQMLLHKAEDALHLNLGQLNQSGVAKEIDKEAHYSMITKIGNNYFDNIMLNSLKFINKIVFPVIGSDDKEIAINKPSTFKVKTEGDLIEEIGTLTEKKVPAIFMSGATMDLAKKYFSGDLLKQKIFTVIAENDPLYVYNHEQLDSMVASGVILKENYIRSVYMYGLMLQIADQMGVDKFIETDNETLMEKFESLIVEFFPEEPEPLFTNPGDTNEFKYDEI